MTQVEKADRFLRVLNDHRALIHKVSNSYAFTSHDREDLFQEIVLQLWRSFDWYNDHYKYSTWIYRIALNVAISSARKQTRQAKIQAYKQGDVNTNLPDDVVNDQVEALYHYIGTMNKIDRALMILYLEETSYQEISLILGITITNVATKIGRLKKKLKNHMMKNT